MRILELTDYSAGGCGVFARAIAESKLLARNGHDVALFSSNLVKGSNEIAKPNETIDGIKIKRFSALQPGRKPLSFLPGGESYIFWNYLKLKEEAIKLNPDVIICHSYRHP